MVKMIGLSQTMAMVESTSAGELDVLHFGVVPLESDVPRGFLGVRGDGESIRTPE